MIDFTKLNYEDVPIIHKIAERASKLIGTVIHGCDRIDIEMDISAVSISYPLRFQEWLDADDFNFNHDILGIRCNLNRKTGKLENGFQPRFLK